MNKNAKRTVIVAAVALVVFSILAFAIPFVHTATFWIAYAFGVVAVLAQLYVLSVAFGKGEDAGSKFYGFPIARVGLIYMCSQLAFSIVFMALAATCPYWIPLVFFAIILGLAIVGLIATDAARDEIQRQDEKVKNETACIKELRAVLAPMADRVEDAAAGKAIKDLAEEFRYSDPVSNDMTRTIEDELKQQVDLLRKAVADGNAENIIALCKKISQMLSERNSLCKAGK